MGSSEGEEVMTINDIDFYNLGPEPSGGSTCQHPVIFVTRYPTFKACRLCGLIIHGMPIYRGA